MLTSHGISKKYDFSSNKLKQERKTEVENFKVLGKKNKKTQQTNTKHIRKALAKKNQHQTTTTKQ